MDARQQLHAEDGHEEDPIIVYDDLEVDDDGQPVKWLWHVECIRCGQPLPHVQVSSSQYGALRAVFERTLTNRRGLR